MLNTLYERFGNSIILLCHEPEDEFCHRRLVVDFIEFNTGIYAPELSVDENGYIRKLLPIRYKNRLRRIMNHDINIIRFIYLIKFVFCFSEYSFFEFNLLKCLNRIS